MKKIVAVIAAALLCLGLCGCSREAVVSGKWDAADQTGSIEFREDGSCSMKGMDRFTWKQDGDVITITLRSEDGSDGKSTQMKIESLSGDTLVLSAGGTKQTFNRAE